MGVGTTARDWLEPTRPPRGSRPVAAAVFGTEPASTSPCVTSYVAVKVRTPPTGMSRLAGVVAVTLGSSIRTSVNGVLPVLVTVNV